LKPLVSGTPWDVVMAVNISGWSTAKGTLWVQSFGLSSGDTWDKDDCRLRINEAIS